jgi:hypothetical protein
MTSDHLGISLPYKQGKLKLNSVIGQWMSSEEHCSEIREKLSEYPSHMGMVVPSCNSNACEARKGGT